MTFSVEKWRDVTYVNRIIFQAFTIGVIEHFSSKVYFSTIYIMYYIIYYEITESYVGV